MQSGNSRSPVPGSPETRQQRGLRIIKVAALCTLGLVFDYLLLQFAFWKEDPMFWRNAGGYSVWLRDQVEILFYPLLCLQFILLITCSLSQVKASRDQGPAQRTFLAVLFLLWTIFACVLLVLLWNNAGNLLQHHSLHYHQPVI